MSSTTGRATTKDAAAEDQNEDADRTHPVREAMEDAEAERLMRTIKEEEVDLTEYENYADAFRHVGRFLNEVYMQKRSHSSLGYLTPAEFKRQWRQQRTQECTFH